MTTRTDFPPCRDPGERVPDETILWSRFSDTVGLWTVLQPDEWPQPEEVTT